MGLKWKDKKHVSLISTMYNGDMIAVTVRKNENKNETKLWWTTTEPWGGVNHVDQRFCSYNVTKRKGENIIKQYFYIF